MLKSYVLSELDRVIHNDPNVHVHGPYSLSVDGPLAMRPIQVFREAQYANQSKYLNDVWQQELEARLGLDERANHFFAIYQKKVVATLRVLAPPFEMSELSSELKAAVALFPNYCELGRLIVDDSARGLGLGKKVIYKSMLYASRQKSEGFIAVCREERVREFERFGMQTFQGQKFKIQSRGDTDYTLMWGKWESIIRRMAGHYGKKRFVNLLSGRPANNWQRFRPRKG